MRYIALNEKIRINEIIQRFVKYIYPNKINEIITHSTLNLSNKRKSLSEQIQECKYGLEEFIAYNKMDKKKKFPYSCFQTWKIII